MFELLLCVGSLLTNREHSSHLCFCGRELVASRHIVLAENVNPIEDRAVITVGRSWYSTVVDGYRKLLVALSICGVSQPVERTRKCGLAGAGGSIDDVYASEIVKGCVPAIVLEKATHFDGVQLAEHHSPQLPGTPTA